MTCRSCPNSFWTNTKSRFEYENWKVFFGVKTMNLLGYKFSAQGMTLFPDRCNAIINFRVPISRKGIVRFMGMVRYYQWFCPYLAEISQPLTKLLRKEANIEKNWGQAIQNIKNMLLSPHMLAHFNPTLETCLQTNASEYAVGAVHCHLVQQNGKHVEKIVCCASKTLDRALANYSVTEKECLAIAIVWYTDLFHTLLH